MPANSDTPSPFAEWLITMSRALGYKRDSEFARALKVEQSTISRWRRGGRPSVEHLAKVSTLTGTQLEPLLVLAGYVSASAVRNAEVPEPPSQVTAGQRIIEDSPVSAEIKGVLLQYWSERMTEERSRLQEFVKIYTEAQQGVLKTPDDVVERVATHVFHTHLNTHVAAVLRGMANAIEAETKESKARAEGGGSRRGGREKGTQAPDPGES